MGDGDFQRTELIAVGIVVLRKAVEGVVHYDEGGRAAGLRIAVRALIQKPDPVRRAGNERIHIPERIHHHAPGFVSVFTGAVHVIGDAVRIQIRHRHGMCAGGIELKPEFSGRRENFAGG